MSIVCNTCGHNNQDDASFCDECGEELTANTLSTEEEETVMSTEESYTEATNSEAASIEESYTEATNSEAASDETEETKQSPFSLPINAATTLELDESPMQEMVSPPTTLEIPELPKAILINQETEEKIILPSEEKTAYIGRLNDEFPVQVDLTDIERADLISRVHAAVHCENEVYYLEDAGSANGTWLNEEQIQPGTRFRQQLNSGDTIAFGRNQTVKFTFDLED